MSRTDNPSLETEQQQRSAWHGSRDYVSYIVILLNEGAAGDEKKIVAAMIAGAQKSSSLMGLVMKMEQVPRPHIYLRE